MPYTVRFTDNINKGELIVEDREINTDTSLKFPGKQSTSYGQDIAENFLHLLENFAAPNPPANPAEGQVWYDNSTTVNQLKVYDGTNWVASGGVKKGNNQPDIDTSLKGDLWVDTANQQLYLNNGGAWILVGPEFSQGLATGVRAEQILGTDDRLYTILRIEVDNNPVAIVSQQGFTPKVTIRGFTKLSPGYNLSTRNFENGVPKYNGIAQSAESLVVSNSNVSAENFLRGDVNSTGTSTLKIKNNQGITVGENGQVTIGAASDRALIRSNFTGASVDIQLKEESGNYKTVIRTINDSVGIANEDPQATLDVSGDLKVETNVSISGTDDADVQFNDDYSSGALVLAGGASIAGNMKVAGDATFASQIKVAGNISTDPDLDAANLPTLTGFSLIEATKFSGVFDGTFEGTVTGASSEASKLTNATEFRMLGDVSSESFTFDGAGSLIKTFTTSIAPGFVSDKPLTDTVETSDEILINRVVGEQDGLHRITQANLVATVPRNPVGMIVPFAGLIPPAGWLICDGREIQIQVYQELFNVIQYNFKDASQLVNSLATHFALPDFRGRFLLGADTMGGVPAATTQDVNASFVGGRAGAESKTIKKNNLPAHEHSLVSPGGIQHYAIRDDLPAEEDVSNNVPSLSIPTGAENISGIPSSGQIRGGGIDANGEYNTVDNELVGRNLDIMPPYATVNYIIFANKE